MRRANSKYRNIIPQNIMRKKSEAELPTGHARDKRYSNFVEMYRKISKTGRENAENERDSRLDFSEN